MLGEEYLIHFTSFKTSDKSLDERDNRGFENLLKIIEYGFRFSPRKTYTPIGNDRKPGIEMNIGMVCFAEIPLEEINSNKGKFGNFGICMKKSWVEKYSGQPVLYSFASSHNNQILIRLNDLICKTKEKSLLTNDEGLNQISLEIADISNIFQALMEPMNHKPEKERRIIDYPNNEILNHDREIWRREEEINGLLISIPVPYLPISQGEDAEFFIIPKAFQEQFCKQVVNRENNEKKIRYIEDFH